MADDVENTQPKISASLSLDPTTHSFSNSQTPNLNLTLTLEDHDGPITIYADDQSTSLMLLCGAFAIHDLSTGVEVKQSKRTHCRIPPPTKVQVDLNTRLFHTLEPGVPMTLSAPFTRNKGEKPRAASDPEYTGRHGACGIDGLEPDRKYVLSLAASGSRIHWQSIRWWEYGTKEELLAGGLDGRKVIYSPGPHEAIYIDTSRVEPVEFACVS